MHSRGWIWAWAGLAFSAAGSPLCAATLVKARLLASVSTYHSKPGDPIEALVAPPPCSESETLPPGSVLSGRVQKVRKVGLGLIHETARMQLAFDQLRLPDGRSYAVETRLVSVDNARERIDKNGAIHGIRATNSLSSRLGSRIAIEVLEHPVHPFLLGPALVLENGLFRFPDPEIEYGRGTELDLRVQIPSSAGIVSVCSADGDESAASVRDLADGLPYWAWSKRQPQPMDLINLVFVGSRSELDAAFLAAGWTGAQRNSMSAGLTVVRALAEDREFARAPMRTLLLDGDEPDVSMQSALNSFEKRDHLRIWKRPEPSEGRTVWASSATRDLAATFSMGHPFGFTHEIEGNVDPERDKVVSDLQLTGCVDSVSYIARPQPPRDSAHEYRKGVHTDGRLAVVMLNDCRSPAVDFAGVSPEPPPAPAVRVFRRVSLTARNHFIRDNIVYRAADDTRLGVRALRGWYVRRHEEQRAEQEDARRARPVETALSDGGE